MSVNELKIQIAKKVFDLEDQDLLLQLDLLLKRESNQVSEDIPEYVKKGIEKGINQADNGQFKTYAEVKKGLSEKWH